MHPYLLETVDLSLALLLSLFKLLVCFEFSLSLVHTLSHKMGKKVLARWRKVLAHWKSILKALRISQPRAAPSAWGSSSLSLVHTLSHKIGKKVLARWRKVLAHWKSILKALCTSQPRAAPSAWGPLLGSWSPRSSSSSSSTSSLSSSSIKAPPLARDVMSMFEPRHPNEHLDPSSFRPSDALTAVVSTPAVVPLIILSSDSEDDDEVN